ncbi:DNA-dependent ATPase mgs1 [Exophiala xenobiotica]|nr:DNA-dependent ATPase mgs1 [Exophiala xenobiotica]KAK5402751.1 DNA-dependent ATPase mgs1 [Exophiala xenobiotica]KAK5405574.1 DNA-dependent ATPase mgs1 [Exophiala xenobiotica]KAK5466324.1 DNA-dependent ATPase mgs1 [Exophiala xenobiotica]KAK5484950.1 DNA-dependent ATPase mgs1 [Exophiala xenobiotica]
MVSCPICGKAVKQSNINNHIDSNCIEDIEQDQPSTFASTPVASFFKTPVSNKRDGSLAFFSSSQPVHSSPSEPPRPTSLKRSFDATFASSTQPVNGHSQDHTHTQTEVSLQNGIAGQKQQNGTTSASATVTNVVRPPPAKKSRTNAYDRAAPLAERMRPRSLTAILGQDLVGPSGILTSLITSDRVPSMILWGASGTGKTTIARVIASMVGSRFVEINSTSSGVAECKKIFAEARSELGLTGRKTIIFCDEIHRFSKSQQDVFLGPVESGTVTLVGATTENPSFRVQSALLSRCRVFVLKKLSEADIREILRRAVEQEGHHYGLRIRPGGEGGVSNADGASRIVVGQGDEDEGKEGGGSAPLDLVNNDELLKYLASFADGDARTALNLLELAMGLSTRPGMTMDTLKRSLTKTMVYDRAGDQHYDTISAFHKSVRGSDPDATLYYLARMIVSGEDPLYIARRMVVIASEDVGLADPTLLPLATATYTAVEKIGMPEARINLAHCAVALSLSKKSTRAYKGLESAMRALQEPGVAGLPVPVHLRNAPTRLMKELGYGKEYKYNPDYIDGRVRQEYLPEQLKGRRFLGDMDLGDRVDEELQQQQEEEEMLELNEGGTTELNGDGHAG